MSVGGSTAAGQNLRTARRTEDQAPEYSNAGFISSTVVQVVDSARTSAAETSAMAAVWLSVGLRGQQFGNQGLSALHAAQPIQLRGGTPSVWKFKETTGGELGYIGLL